MLGEGGKSLPLSASQGQITDLILKWSLWGPRLLRLSLPTTTLQATSHPVCLSFCLPVSLCDCLSDALDELKGTQVEVMSTGAQIQHETRLMAEMIAVQLDDVSAMWPELKNTEVLTEHRLNN